MVQIYDRFLLFRAQYSCPSIASTFNPQGLTEHARPSCVRSLKSWRRLKPRTLALFVGSNCLSAGALWLLVERHMILFRKRATNLGQSLSVLIQHMVNAINGMMTVPYMSLLASFISFGWLRSIICHLWTLWICPACWVSDCFCTGVVPAWWCSLGL